ncbi:PREDICTED: disintegrin and metalloproteinase domain-containing protein 18-like [Elephantulus edwardii]|uniref:disintegrin and metalloproteinase domain-containing protein 18-like n=1 Tax=Elephantulus edwardii TaxID=28737 RepID=UPI0003F0CC4F|nr:PREDICTED: disintegrin and metalloproteinase domain-containing protein 18-like [Elephantulus edwardii]
MLPLLLLLLGLGRLTSADQNSETPFLQITIPQKIWTDTKDGDTSQTRIIYVIEINGKAYTLHLEKQSFLPPHFLVYSYSKLGIRLLESPFVKDHCFYQGYTEEIPKSIVTLNTCYTGLRGLLQLENVSYGIEPMQSSSTYEHIIYQIRDKKIDFYPLGKNYSLKEFEDQFYKILVKSDKYSNVMLINRTLHVQIVMDKALYDYMGSEVAVAAEKVVQIFSLINTMFSQLKMTIMLSSLELWSDKNKISTHGDADDILQRFLSWKHTYLAQRPGDMAYLLIYRDYANYVGATYQGVACNPKLAAGIALYPKAMTLEALSMILTQLLAVNLGLTYDDIHKCYCPGNACVMNPTAMSSRGVKFFSSCSLDEFNHRVTQPEFECLQDKIVSRVSLQGRTSYCGNGILEPPEQCDCGTAEKCQLKKCCNPAECTLIGYAECGTGACCDKKTCQLTDHGTLCRESVDPCDFKEYCNGTSEYCPEDMKSADLEPCLNYASYCYKGICRTMDRQCVQLFGKFAKGADYLCTEEVNFHGDDFGNCKGKPCRFENILCGKVVCHWSRGEVIPLTHYDIQYTYLRGHVCISAFLRNESIRNRYDDTYVSDGSICGSNKVCNQRLHCQCHVGYVPPNCDPSETSLGGSIDDGFWLLSESGVPLIVKQRAARKRNDLLISFYVFLPLLVLTTLIALKWNKMREFWNRGSINEDSASEDSNQNSNLTQ